MEGILTKTTLQNVLGSRVRQVIPQSNNTMYQNMKSEVLPEHGGVRIQSFVRKDGKRKELKYS